MRFQFLQRAQQSAAAGVERADVQHAGLGERWVCRPLKEGVGLAQLAVERQQLGLGLGFARPVFPHPAPFGKQHYYYTPFVKWVCFINMIPVFSLFIQPFPE